MFSPSALFAAAFSLGILCTLFPSVHLLLLAAVCTPVLFFLPRARFAICALLAGCAVALLHYWHWQRLAWPAVLDKSPQTVQLQLIDFSKRTERGWQVIASDSQGRKLRLAWLQEQPLQYHCRYQAQVQLQRPRGLLNPEIYDFEAWLIAQGFHATGVIKSVAECQPQRMSFWLGWRLAIANWLTAQPFEAQVIATLNGLLIGNYAELERSDWQQLRETGTIHLLSVSGLHIALVAALVGGLVTRSVRLCTRLTLILPALIWGSIAAVVIASAYSLLAGFSVPTQRSLIMVVVACAALLLRGRWQWSQALAIAAIAVLCINPFSILSVGFWFSFAATLCVLLAAQCAPPPQSQSYARFYQAVWLLIKLQFTLFIVMLPLLLFNYGRVYALSLPMNLLAVPWVSFISLPLAFIATALLPLWQDGAQYLLNLSAWSLSIYWQAIAWVTQSPVNWQWQASVNNLALCVVAAAALYSWQILPSRFYLKHFLLLCLLPLLIPRQHALAADELRIIFLDVGQGLAVLVMTQNHLLLYDTGNRYSASFDVGRDIVVPVIEKLGRTSLDAIVISHADSDHAAGLPAVLEHLPAPTYAIDAHHLRDKFALARNYNILPCAQGLRWQFDQIVIAVVSPAPHSRFGSNGSCVLLVQSPHAAVLLTGDMEKQQELAMLADPAVTQQLLRKPILAISAPHHGSSTSSTASLLSALQPQVAVISSGYLNRYQHPSSKVLARYRAYQVTALNTAELGQLQLVVDRQGAHWRAALCEDTSLWRRSRRSQAVMCDTSANRFR